MEQQTMFSSSKTETKNSVVIIRRKVGRDGLIYHLGQGRPLCGPLPLGPPAPLPR